MPRKPTGKTGSPKRTKLLRVRPLPFRDKLVLNRWLISLFGVEAIGNPTMGGREVRPFQAFTEFLKDETEGLGPDGRHRFYERLRLGNDLFTWAEGRCQITRDDLLRYEERISAHTQAINERRDDEPVKWKYFQWLELLFTEIYLDRYFRDRAGLLADLNEFVGRFNEHWGALGYAPVPLYDEEALNKVCIQIATGGGKTLLMHVNLLQFRQYEKEAGGDALDYAYLVTPNERLSAQHLGELGKSGLFASRFVLDGSALGTVQVLEISKLADSNGPTTVSTAALGNRNLLLVDEAHAGIAGNRSEKADDRAWQRRRSAICEKGFAFEYSATFAQAVHGTDHEDAYAKSVLFDYSYRWFYADGYGKDYRIFNIPEKGTLPPIRFRYLTGMLLSHYQQLRIWETDGGVARGAFHLEKPLWVFVGSTVSASRSGALTGDDAKTATDVAEILRFIAQFLGHPDEARAAIHDLLWKTGADTGLLTAEGIDLFTGTFATLKTTPPGGTRADAATVYSDILRRVFHGQSGRLVLERIPGKDGEIVLRAQGSKADEPFGLVSVGSPKELCAHLASLPDLAETIDFSPESEFSRPLFASLRESSSPVDLLVGSKKFVEGWDCWRVGTLGLMHVGRSEGAQIIQLFGRGVRLKGWERQLKRSSRSGAPSVPPSLPALETLGVFGIEADFMQKFRDYLKEEGLPGNEQSNLVTLPLTVTYDFARHLKILRPKKHAGEEYDFQKDARVPCVGDDIPDSLVRNPVQADWYPRIQSVESRDRRLAAMAKNTATLPASLLSLLDWDEIYFALETFKRERSWYNLDLSPGGLRKVLEKAVAGDGAARPWYMLAIPAGWLDGRPNSGRLRTVKAIAIELLKRYVERLYNDRKAAFYQPRLELREVTDADLMLPLPDGAGDRFYSFSIEGATEEETAELAEEIRKLGEELKEKRDELVEIGNIRFFRFARKGAFRSSPSVWKKANSVSSPICADGPRPMCRSWPDWKSISCATWRRAGASVSSRRPISTPTSSCGWCKARNSGWFLWNPTGWSMRRKRAPKCVFGKPSRQSRNGLATPMSRWTVSFCLPRRITTNKLGGHVFRRMNWLIGMCCFWKMVGRVMCRGCWAWLTTNAWWQRI